MFSLYYIVTVEEHVLSGRFTSIMVISCPRQCIHPSWIQLRVHVTVNFFLVLDILASLNNACYSWLKKNFCYRCYEWKGTGGLSTIHMYADKTVLSSYGQMCMVSHCINRFLFGSHFHVPLFYCLPSFLSRRSLFHLMSKTVLHFACYVSVGWECIGTVHKCCEMIGNKTERRN